MFEDKLIVDMYYSENHVEVNLDAFLASEEYAKESIKDLELDLEQVFDQNADGSTYMAVLEYFEAAFLCFAVITVFLQK